MDGKDSENHLCLGSRVGQRSLLPSWRHAWNEFSMASVHYAGERVWAFMPFMNVGCMD
jgi:hypothetical protein